MINAKRVASFQKVAKTWFFVPLRRAQDQFVYINDLVIGTTITSLETSVG